MRTVFAYERADLLLAFLETKFLTMIRTMLTPALHGIAEEYMWQMIQEAVLQQLLPGQNPDYYRQIKANNLISFDPL